MNIENLKEGMVVKNYRELCKLLGIEVKAGNTKIAQIKELETFCSFHKEGNKFVIDEIYEVQKDKEDGREGGYSEMRTMLLRMLLLCKEEDTVVFPTSVLLKKLSAINNNYATGRRRQEELGEILNIDKSYVEDFYKSTNVNLQRGLETNLNKLQKKRLLFWSNEIMICKNKVGEIKKNKLGEPELDSNGNIVCTITNEFRVATDEERKMILDTEKEILNMYGFKEIGDVYKHCVSDEFYKKVYKKINEYYNISYYFLGYKIIFNKDTIRKELDSIEDLPNLIIASKIMNASVSERILTNAENRHYESRDILASETDIKPNVLKRLEMRSAEEYMENMNTLINTVIKLGADDITEELNNLRDKKNEEKRMLIKSIERSIN